MKDLYTFELDKRDFENIKNGKKTIHLTMNAKMKGIFWLEIKLLLY